MIPTRKRVFISNPAPGSSGQYTSIKRAKQYVADGRACLSTDEKTLTFVTKSERHQAVLRHCKSHPIAFNPHVPNTHMLRVPVRRGPKMMVVAMMEAFDLLSDPFKGMPVLPPSAEYLEGLLTLDKNRRFRKP
jgi:hypothetical protein